MIKLSFSLQHDGHKEMIDSLDKVKKHVGDNKQTFEKMAEDVIYPELKKDFIEFKGKWEKNQPVYVMPESMRRLEKSLTDKNAEGAIFKVSKDKLEIGSKVMASDGRTSLAKAIGHSRKNIPIVTRDGYRSLFEKCSEFYMKQIGELKKKLWGFRKS